MVKPAIPGTAGKAVYQPLVRSWWNWDTYGQSVVVKRHERATTSSQWDEQVQELSTSFYVVHVGARVGASNISELIVAGFYPTGESCIERWVFSYPEVPIPVGGGYVPINQRKMPKCQRIELLRSNQYGPIRCVEADPDGRFILFLTRNDVTLHRMTLPAGSVSVELSQATVPFLANAKMIAYRVHSSEGRQYHLLASPAWSVDGSASRNALILKDANNDAVFESAIVLTPQDWANVGYNNSGAWLTLY